MPRWTYYTCTLYHFFFQWGPLGYSGLCPDGLCITVFKIDPVLSDGPLLLDLSHQSIEKGETHKMVCTLLCSQVTQKTVQFVFVVCPLCLQH